jgi:hypothetical protein
MERERGGGSREFEAGGPGETAGPDAGTRERPRGTAGPRAEDGPSAEEMGRRLATADVPGHADESMSAADDRALYGRLPDLNDAELARLSVLVPGTALEQGGTYLDLNELGRGPFRAIGGQEAGVGNRYIAKRETDYELWNRLAGDRETEPERPREVE